MPAASGSPRCRSAELAPDNNETFRQGVIQTFEGTADGPRPPDAWGALAAWAWGASRAMDYFETHAGVDARRVAVVGHSRGGKAALWAGAEDQRFAMVVSNESGESGAALSRRNFGETIARITTAFPYWFAANYRSFAGTRGVAADRSTHAALADRAAGAVCRERRRGPLVGSARRIPGARPLVAGVRAVGRSRDCGRRDAAARTADAVGPPRVSHPPRAAQSHALRLGSLRGFRRRRLGSVAPGR